MVRVVLIVADAAWHRSTNVAWPINITLLFLRPYSPELSGSESLRPQVRLRLSCDRVLPSHQVLQDPGNELESTSHPESSSPHAERLRFSARFR